MNKEKILGFDVCTFEKKELIENIFQDYLDNEKLFIVNINPEIVVHNFKNKEIKEKFNNQKYQIPDGNGIVWASKKRKGSIKERIAGIDLMNEICQKSQAYNSKVYLYGSKQKNIEMAKIELEKTYPNIKIVGIKNGYCEENDVLEDIKQKKPDIIFVGLGSPRQERFIINHIQELESAKIMMPVGGSFDIISKAKKRAPKFFIKYKLEWLYRLIKEPKRLFRQIKLVKFIFLVIGEKHEKN